MDTISELVQKCWDVLLTILPRDIYVTMLREYLLMNEHQEEWKSFVKIFTTFNKEIKDILKPYIANITFGLHLLYENFKLSIITIPYLKALGLLLAMLATTLKWKLFLDLYYRDFGCKMITGESKGPAIVPNIFQWIQLENYEDFPFCGFSVECIEKLTRTVKLFSCLSSPEDFLSELIRNNMTRADIDFYPFGVSKIFRNVLEKLKMKPLSHFGPAEYNLIEREDLASLFQKEFEPQDQFYDFETRVGKNIFPDKRLEQIYAKLSSSTPINAPDDNDINFQEFLVKSSKRICSNSIGRGMLSLSSSKLKDENTKLFVIPPLVLAVKAVRNVISNLDMSQMAPNALLWPEFHHGCSYGLAIISPEKLTREWILHQKPQGANCYFSGFLLSLGLNGHLISFLATDVYTLLHSKHMPTTVSTLLGVCVSKRGSQDMNLTKALSLHIPSLTSSIDLEIAQETQAASLVSLGYLYLDSSHRFISEILLNELTRQSDDCITDREGYALAAGIGLGLVNLGRGNTSQGLTDLKLTEKLKLYMLGGKLKVTSKKPLDYSIKIKESDVFINTIISGSAATICLCLLYLQTNDTLVASYMEIPRSKYLLEYIKPMQAYLRTLCRNLILWKDIHASESWILNQVIKNSEDEEDTEVEVAALNAHIISGACMSIGMKYAGTGNKDAIKVILHFLHKFEASTVDSLSKETCILMSAIAVSLVVAGSGNIEIVKVLNRIRKYQVTFGNHMALSMALGVVFLGGCRFSFSTSKFAIANLLIAFFPRFPSVSTENRFHLQALRHFYVLAAEPRFLETVDVETGVEVVVEVRITVSDDEIIVKTPCLLPEIGCIRSIHVEDEKFYPLHITHENQIAKLKNMKIYLKRNQKEDVQKWLVPLAKEANDSISLWSLKLSFEENVTFENIFARLERKFELNKDVLKNYLLGKLMDDEFDEKFALGLVLFDIPTPGGLKTLEMNSSHVLGGLCLQNPKWECLSLNTIENVLKELKNE
jgi:anaphase-promoting complex subunit 1